MGSRKMRADQAPKHLQCPKPPNKLGLISDPEIPSTDTDESETKGTFTLCKVILEQDEEVRIQQLCNLRHGVKQVSSKPMTESGEGRELMSDKEKHSRVLGGHATEHTLLLPFRNLQIS